jgi:ER membrane protein complex subunit 6
MSAPSADTDAQQIFIPNLKHNAALMNVKFVAASFAGAVAGVLGLENWLGFALFLSSTFLTSATIFLVNCKGNPAAYIPGGLAELVNPGQENVFTFLLVWTLFYGMPHTMSFLERNAETGLGIVHGEFSPFFLSSYFTNVLIECMTELSS